MNRTKESLSVLIFLLLGTSTYGQVGFGHIKIASKADTLYMQMETVKLKVGTKDTLSFPVGEYVFQLMAKGFRDRTVRFIVKEGELVLVQVNLDATNPILRESDKGSYPYLDWGKSLHLETDSDSRIELNGSDLGIGQWMGLVDTGRVKIKVTHSTGRSLTRMVYVHPNRLHSLDLHLRLTRREHILNSFIPGLSPYRKQQHVRMVAAPVLVGVLIQQSWAHQREYKDLQDEYRDVRNSYRIAPPNLADETARLAKRKADQVNAMYGRRNLMYGLTLASYALTYLDGVRPGPLGYRQGGMRLDPYIQSNPNGDGFLPAFKFAKSF